MRVTNAGNDPVFLRMVLPKIRSLVTPETGAHSMGVVPKELE